MSLLSRPLSFVRPSVGRLVCQKAINIRLFHQMKAIESRSSELKVRVECLMMRSRLSKSRSVCTSVHPTIHLSVHSSLALLQKQNKKTRKIRFFIERSKGHGKSIDVSVILSVCPSICQFVSPSATLSK